MTLPLWLLVALGGALGSLARYGSNNLTAAWLGTAFPLHTAIVNVLGCFLMGILVGVGTYLANVNEAMRAFLVIVILGGFTTFSAFSLDVLDLAGRGHYAAAAGYVGLSVVCSLLAAFAGLALVRMWA